ncbi:FAD-dependent oxidoreductase [Bosea sp. RCC_152_1]|uniref:FAD-dependent oxidoreductase n=1 Tax=Bosea sp. RCC_152_1 TaxID=3239228 RepID=UPI0035246B7B
MLHSTSLHATEALRLLGPFPENWVPVRDGIDHDVVIVGGGHTGSSFAFALNRAGIRRISVIDAAPDEASSGIWLTRARMNLLRTPKNLPGPELGVQGLGFQAWYEAQHGKDAFAELVRIPRTDWAAYLSWFRTILRLPIRYGVRLVRIETAAGHLRLHLETPDGARIETARKVILGNGVAGSGYPYLPPALEWLPRHLRAHTHDSIDFEPLRGESIAVIGAAASAFDTAGAALEAGAREVHLFARRDHIPAMPVSRARGYPGAYDNYRHLPDEVRWHQAYRFRESGSTPTPDAIERAVRFSNFHIHLSSPWLHAHEEDGGIVATLPGRRVHADFVIAATGYRVDLARRSELAGIAGEVLLWRDRYQPPAEETDDDLGAHPYLGYGHELLEKSPGAAPELRNIHVYNPGGFVSFGLPIGDVPSLRRDVPAVVSAISRDLFLADFDRHRARIVSQVAPEFGRDAYSSALWARQAAE